MWCVADLDEDYIADMEDTLETYERPHDAQQPVVCLDEKPVTLHAEVRPFSAAQPGLASKGSKIQGMSAGCTYSIFRRVGPTWLLQWHTRSSVVLRRARASDSQSVITPSFVHSLRLPANCYHVPSGRNCFSNVPEERKPAWKLG